MEFEFLQEKELSATTIQELDAMVKKMFALRDEADELESKAKELKSECEMVKHKVMEILEATNRTNHETPGAGKVYTQTKYQVTFPKEPEKAAQFRQYILDNGLDSMLTVNHQTLNSFYKQELERLGEAADPSSVLPGVGAPEQHVVLAMKRGK